MSFDVNANTGTQWFFQNFITGSFMAVDNLTNIVNAVEDPSAIRYVTKSGSSGKLTVGSPQIADQVVAAYKLYTGQAGAANATDPISISAQNLKDAVSCMPVLSSTPSTAVIGSHSSGDVPAANTGFMANIQAKTGLPSIVIWIIFIGGAIFIIPKIWKKLRGGRR
jgi:hypothetical protein